MEDDDFPPKPVYIPRKKREAMAKEEEERKKKEEAAAKVAKLNPPAVSQKHEDSLKPVDRASGRAREAPRKKDSDDDWQEQVDPVSLIQREEIERAKKHYQGEDRRKKTNIRMSEKYKSSFKFEWDQTEDTTASAAGQAVVAVRQKKVYDEFEAPSRKKLGKQTESVSILDKEVEDMTERDWRIFRENNDIIVRGRSVPNPIRSWEDLEHVPQAVYDNIERQGYKRPMPVQMQAVTAGQQMRDVLGLAPTGSGKSCAFLLPMISFLMGMPPVDGIRAEDGPYGLIMAPTRELAQQIDLEFQKLSKGTRLRSVVVVGGKSSQEQGSAISRGVEIVIGTPGRIEDCLDRRLLVLSQCYFCILDEADKMIEMDLEESVNKILSGIPQSLRKSDDPQRALEQEEKMFNGEGLVTSFMLFSATMAPEIEKLSRNYLKHPVHVQIGDLGSAKKEITQKIEFVHGGEQKKKQILAKLLKRYPQSPIIIFVNEKVDTEVVQEYISKELGISCVALHGSKAQAKREAALESLRDGRVEVMVCTNVAARGIDIDSVAHVINYSAPKSFTDYVHRIGRTGRAGKKGMATTFLQKEDEGIFYDLRKYLADNEQAIPSELAEHPSARVPKNVLQ